MKSKLSDAKIAAGISCIIVLGMAVMIFANLWSKKLTGITFELAVIVFLVPAGSVLAQGIPILLGKGRELALLKGVAIALKLFPLILLGFFAFAAIFPGDLESARAIQEITVPFAAFCLLVALPYFITHYAIEKLSREQVMQSQPLHTEKSPHMQIELVRVRVKEGKREVVDEWLGFLNINMAAVQETLEPEHMYVETIFSEIIDGVDYLYWYAVRGEEGLGQKVSESPHWLDKKHMEYWRECIDPEYSPVRLTPRVHMAPERVRASMKPASQ